MTNDLAGKVSESGVIHSTFFLARPSPWWCLGAVFFIFQILLSTELLTFPTSFIAGMIITPYRLVIIAETLGILMWLISLFMFIRTNKIRTYSLETRIKRTVGIVAKILVIPILLATGFLMPIPVVICLTDDFHVLYPKSSDGYTIIIDNTSSMNPNLPDDATIWIDTPDSIILENISSSEGKKYISAIHQNTDWTLSWNNDCGVLKIQDKGTTVICPA